MVRKKVCKKIEKYLEGNKKWYNFADAFGNEAYKAERKEAEKIIEMLRNIQF